ncbi:MAG TPA: hypothetical protein VKH82_03860 [Candidatus Binatia bacterium]|nr:hypothetical protein [Candidatus Binatia bacterium]
MLYFIEPSLAEVIHASVRDLIAAAIPPVAAVGVALAIAAAVLVRARRALGRGQRPRPLPAAI